MSKLYYLHLVTGLVAASVAFIPRQSVASAIAAGFVAGGGSAVAQKVTQQSLSQRMQESSTSEAELELKKQRELLQQYRDRLQDMDRAISTSQKEQARLSQLVQEKDQLIAEQEGSLKASLNNQDQLYHRNQEYQHLLQESQQKVYELTQLQELYHLEIQKLKDQFRSIQQELDSKKNLIEERELTILEKDDKINELNMCISDNKQILEGYQETVESLSGNVRLTQRQHLIHSSNSELVFNVTEQDLYPKEIKSFILEILDHKKNQVHENSRIFHILDDLTSQNDASEGKKFRNDLKDSLDHLFRDYQKWNHNTLENELQRLQFDVASMNDHIKICFSKDNRYTITFAKTAGDWRAGLNILRDIRKTIFGLTE